MALLLRPIAITPAMLTASNAGAADANYNPATSYGLGARVFVPDDGKTYECIQAPALGQYPPSSPLYWYEAAPSNRWAMWDAEISTATVVAGGLTATVAPGVRFNAVSLHGLVGTSVTLTQKAPGGAVVWTQTRVLQKDPVGWYSYFYEPRSQVTQAVFLNLVPMVGSTLEIAIAGASAACAAVRVGSTVYIGAAQYGFGVGIQDYSKKDTNTTTGVQKLAPGPYSRRVTGTLELPTPLFARTDSALVDVRGSAVTWIGVENGDDYTPFTVLGFFRDFQIEAPGPSHCICSLEIEGMTTS